MPWYMFALIGSGLIYLSTTPFFKAEQRITEIEMALLAGPPAAVELATYRRPDGIKFAEATFHAQIVTEQTQNLFRRRGSSKSIARTEYTMLVLAEPDASKAPKPVKGLIVVEKEVAAGLQQFVDANHISDGPLGPVVSINGEVSSFDPSTEAEQALAKRGFGTRPDLIYIEPFLGGRDAHLRTALSKTSSTDSKALLWGHMSTGSG